MRDTIQESTLVAAACAGDATAFGLLFRKHYQSVYALAYRLQGDVSNAEDVAQMVFLRAAKAIHGFHSNARFETWLYRITVNVVKDQSARARTSRRAIQMYADYKADRAADCGPVEYRLLERRDDIQTALLQLPHKERAAIVLTVCLDMTHIEAAKILSCSEGTVSWRVHRAKKMLHSFLNNKECGDG